MKIKTKHISLKEELALSSSCQLIFHAIPLTSAAAANVTYFNPNSSVVNQ